MKTFAIRDYFNPKHQEYIIGSKEIGKHSVYLVMGEMKKGEKREIRPDGHDEILFLLSGEAALCNRGNTTRLQPDGALHLEPEETATIEALEDCRYVTAGAHANHHHHHHHHD